MTTSHLHVVEVGKTFGRHRALHRVSVDFAPGEVTAVLGPNGAGKSTLLAILSMLSRPSTGQIRFGEDRLTPGSTLRRQIGYVGHEPGVYGDLSARQNLQLFAKLYGLPDATPAVAAMLERVGLGDVRADLPARSFSRGMQQRLSLARALLHTPAILLFDEPASALDPTGAKWLADELIAEKEAGRLVVLVTHDLAAAADVADHVVVLRRGKVAMDRKSSQKFSPADMRDLYAEALNGA